MILLSRVTAGITFTALSVLAMAGLLGAWFRNAPPRLTARGDAGAETTLWRAYRTADARLSRKFLGHVAAVESELQRAATDERWSIDWKAHEREYSTAKTALEAGDSAEAFRRFAQSIDVLMEGILQHRRQMQHEKQWGRTAESAAENTEKQ
ncbi:MAG: hypothetical protein IID45_05010 [Planctomycetes bacterium]|nr:hypothetical protein [Planctomycetota bacterium]